jgi:acetoin utilization protein AcuB
MTATMTPMPANLFIEVMPRPPLEARRSWLDVPIAEFMIRNPATVAVSDNLGTVKAKMNRAGVGHLPVLDRGRPVGMVTARDLARSMIVPLTELTPPEIARLLDSPVSWVMSKPVVSLPPQAPLKVAIRLMIGADVGSVVVIDLEDGKILGLVTRSVILEQGPFRSDRIRLPAGTS